MIVVYRHGTFGHYIEALKYLAYRHWFGPYAWEGNWPNECCWIVPGTEDQIY